MVKYCIYEGVGKNMIDIRLKELSQLYEIKDIDKVRNNTGGIYLLFNVLDQLIYVGRSQDLKGRLNHHFSGTTHTVEYHKEFYYFRVMYTNSRYEQKIYELYAINEFKPYYNKMDVFEELKVLNEVEEMKIKTEKEKEIETMVKFISRFMNKNKSRNIEISMLKDLLKTKKIDHGELFHSDTMKMLEENGVYLIGRGFVKK